MPAPVYQPVIDDDDELNGGQLATAMSGKHTRQKRILILFVSIVQTTESQEKPSRINVSPEI